MISTHDSNVYCYIGLGIGCGEYINVLSSFLI